MDPAGRAEAALVARHPAFLEPVWRDAHWQLFRVRDSAPVAAGAGARARLLPAGVEVTAPRAGRLLLRVRWTAYWRLAGAVGCVTPRGGWTVLDAAARGRFLLTARFSAAGLLRRGPRCVRPVRPRPGGLAASRGGRGASP
jgi:hypothetical protein